MKDEELDDLVKIAEAKNISAEELKNRIEEKYEDVLDVKPTRNYDVNNIEIVKELSDLTGIKPSEELVQSTYLKLLNNQWSSKFRNFGLLREATKIKPNEKVEESIHNMYEEDLNASEILKIKENTGVAPSKEIIEDKLWRWIDFKSGSMYGKSSIMADYLKLTESFDISEEIVQKKYEEIIKTRFPMRIGLLKKITGIKPELEEDVVQQKYRELLVNDSVKIYKFEWLLETTGIKPRLDREEVQEIYSNLDPVFLLRLNKTLEIKPNLKKEVLQEKYDQSLFHQKNLKSLVELTGIKPEFKEETLERAYLDCLNKVDASLSLEEALKVVETLKELGVDHKMSQDMAKKFYEAEAIENGGIIMSRAFRLSKLTGIDVPEETIQKAYWNMVREDSCYRYSKKGAKEERVNELEELSGVEIKLSDEQIQKVYSDILTSSQTNYTRKEKIMEMENITGVNISQETLRKKYLSILDNTDSKLQELYALKDIETFMEKDIPKSTIEDTQGKYLMNKSWRHIKALKDVTGINPRESDIQEAYLKYAKDHDKKAMDKLEKITDIEPAKEARINYLI